MVHSKHSQTATLHTHYLECGDTTKDIIVLLHGNVSSSAFFKPFMEKLPNNLSLCCTRYARLWRFGG